MDFGNLNAEKGYSAMPAYGQSKLANLLFTYELQRQFEDARVDAIAAAVHPGATATNLPASWTTVNPRAHWRMVRILNSFIGQKPKRLASLPII